MELTLPKAIDVRGEYFGTWGLDIDYKDIVDRIGPVLTELSNDYYSGDTFVIYGESWDGEVAYLNFGWGSCSGCDALQACTELDEADKVIAALYAEIKHFENVHKLYDYLSDEKANRWEYFNSEYKKLVLEVEQHL